MPAHMPPRFSAPSSTTGPTPYSASAFAAARPLGPVPMIATLGIGRAVVSWLWDAYCSSANMMPPDSAVPNTPAKFGPIAW